MTAVRLRREVLVLAVALASPLLADEGAPALTFERKGNAYLLFTRFHDGATGDDDTLHTARLRLDTDVRHRNRKWNLKTVLDMEAFSGSLLRSPLWATMEDPQEHVYWDLSGDTNRGESLHLRHSIHRLYLTYSSEALRWDLGKQRVAWGVARFWRPTDVFNPESPLQIQTGERTGLDALRFRVPLFLENSLEGVYAPSRDPGLDSRAAKYRFRIGKYDIATLGGTVRGNDVLGLTFDGYVGKGGARGEVLRVDPDVGDAYTMWTVGGDYAFRNTLTLTLEYLHNDGATTAPVDPLQAYQGILRTRSRGLLGFSASYKTHPLVNWTLFVSLDTDEDSWAVMPRWAWSVKEDVEVSAGAALFGGSAGEFADAPRTYFVQATTFF